MLTRSVPLIVAIVVSAFGCAASSEDAGASAPPTTDESNFTSGTVLLDCDTFLGGGGPDQSVKVIKKEDGKLLMRELTNHGSTVERPMEESEWASKSFKLREDSPGDVSTLRWDIDAWINESKSPGFRVFGFAECSVDKSQAAPPAP